MIKILTGLLGLALLGSAAAGCGSDASTEKPAKPAAATTSAAPKLDAEEQRALDKLTKSFTAYCADKSVGEPVGSAALAESLLDFGAGVQTASGTTLGDTLAVSRDELRACGAKPLAKRLQTALRSAGS
jgi:hypothetical protein